MTVLRNPTMTLCQRGNAVACHPQREAPLVFRAAGDPWTHLFDWLPTLPMKTLPQADWTITMRLRCQHCGEARMVELVQSHRGQGVWCNVCGRVGPVVAAGSSPDSSSPKPVGSGATAGAGSGSGSASE